MDIIARFDIMIYQHTQESIWGEDVQEPEWEGWERFLARHC